MLYEVITPALRDRLDTSRKFLIPLGGSVEEYVFLRDRLRTIAARSAGDVPVVFGTMIEIPRAALTADEIAQEADFFSFGTNDLTQMGLSYNFV